MKCSKKLLFILVLGLVLATVMCGCGAKKTGDNSSIVIGIPQDLEDSLDPHEAVAAGTKEILFNIFEGLYKPDEEGNLIPAVASDYEVSSDGLTYIFTLRDGITFHDGTEVKTEDVEYSIKKAAGMLGGESLIAAFANISDVQVIDSKEVSITLKEQDVDFLSYIANTNACIIPKNNSNPASNPVGTGPYMYVSRSPQENIILKKYSGYWGEPANIDNITLKVIADADSIVMNLNGGSADMFCRVTSDQVNQLNDSFEIYKGEMNLVQAVYLNNQFEPFSDIRVRQALCYGVNIQELLDLTSNGEGYPVGSSMYPAFKKYYVNLADSYPYDAQKAKSILKEAGYENLEFTITVPSNYQQHIDAAQVVAAQLKNIGVTANIQLVEWNTWLSEVYSSRNYEATVIGVDASSLTASAMLSRFVSDASNNFVNYSNAEYDNIYSKVLITVDDSARTDMYKKLQNILAEDAANIYIQDMAEFVALSDKYEGYTFYPLYVQDFAKLKLK